jgi:hypothetical protein
LPLLTFDKSPFYVDKLMLLLIDFPHFLSAVFYGPEMSRKFLTSLANSTFLLQELVQFFSPHPSSNTMESD